MKFTCLTFLLLLALVGGCSKSAPPRTTKTYPLGKLGTLALTFPEAWREDSIRVREMDTNKSMTFDAISFMPTNSSNFAFLIELVPVNETNAATLDLKSLLQQKGRAELANAVETSLDIRNLNGREASGNYFRITDKRWTNAPPPGEFKYLTQGFAKLGPLVLTFRLVAADVETEPEALETIRTARITKP